MVQQSYSTKSIGKKNANVVALVKIRTLFLSYGTANRNTLDANKTTYTAMELLNKPVSTFFNIGMAIVRWANGWISVWQISRRNYTQGHCFCTMHTKKQKLRVCRRMRHESITMRPTYTIATQQTRSSEEELKALTSLHCVSQHFYTLVSQIISSHIPKICTRRRVHRNHTIILRLCIPTR